MSRSEIASWKSLTRDLEFWPGPVNHNGAAVMVRYKSEPCKIGYVPFDHWEEYCKDPDAIRFILDTTSAE